MSCSPLVLSWQGSFALVKQGWNWRDKIHRASGIGAFTASSLAVTLGLFTKSVACLHGEETLCVWLLCLCL